MVIIKISREIVKALLEPLPQIVVDAVAAIFLNVFEDLLAKVLVGVLRSRHPKHGELSREQSRSGQIVECRHQQPSGKVSGSAEDHHHAGIALLSDTRRSRFGLFRYLSHESVLFDVLCVLGEASAHSAVKRFRTAANRAVRARAALMTAFSTRLDVSPEFLPHRR